jgi:hypothetical protein
MPGDWRVRFLRGSGVARRRTYLAKAIVRPSPSSRAPAGAGLRLEGSWQRPARASECCRGSSSSTVSPTSGDPPTLGWNTCACTSMPQRQRPESCPRHSAARHPGRQIRRHLNSSSVTDRGDQVALARVRVMPLRSGGGRSACACACASVRLGGASRDDEYMVQAARPGYEPDFPEGQASAVVVGTATPRAPVCTDQRPDGVMAGA